MGIDCNCNQDFINLKNKIMSGKHSISADNLSLHQTRRVLISLYNDIKISHEKNGNLDGILGLAENDFALISRGDDIMMMKAKDINDRAFWVTVSFPDEQDELNGLIQEYADSFNVYSSHILDNLAEYVRLSLGLCMLNRLNKTRQ